MMSKRLSALLFLVSLALLSCSFAVSEVAPGVYIMNITSSISNGTSTEFIVYSSTGLEVNVDTSNAIYPLSTLQVAWTPFASLDFNATISLINLLNTSQVYSSVVVNDTGSVMVDASAFGEFAFAPGFYNVTVSNALGMGISNTFVVQSPVGLNVIVDLTTVPTDQPVNVSWIPSNPLGLVNVSVLRLFDSSVTPIYTDIIDTGFTMVGMSFLPGAYEIMINSSLGNGVSPIIEVTSTTGSIDVSAVPNNVSSMTGVSTISWAPFDPYQSNVTLSIYQNIVFITNLTVPNTGSYTLDVSAVGLGAGLYNLTIDSNIGSGSAMLNVYSATGLAVTVPNKASIIYNNSVGTPVQWAPFDSMTSNVNITFVNQNTLQAYSTSAINDGDASVDLIALGIPAGTYNLSVASDLGTGESSMFVIRYADFLNITSPNMTTNVSNIGLLDIDWDPTNQAGGNVTVFLYQVANGSVVYGPFSAIDDGNAEINLATDQINKSLVNGFVQQEVALARPPTHKKLKRDA